VSHAGSGGTQPLWQALYAAGGEIVITGHDHDYERFAPQTATGVADATYGVREFVVGTGGAGLGAFTNTVANSEARNNSAHGVLKLTLRDGGYDWQFVPEAGQTFTDSGSGNCHGSPGSSNQLPTASYTSSCTGLSCAFTDQSSGSRRPPRELELGVRRWRPDNATESDARLRGGRHVHRAAHGDGRQGRDGHNVPNGERSAPRGINLHRGVYV